LTKSDAADSGVPVCLLPRLVESWLLAGDINRHSRRTLGSLRERTGKLLWFLNQREIECCDRHALRQFFHYVSHGHAEPGGGGEMLV
jgi:hypothetical protein